MVNLKHSKKEIERLKRQTHMDRVERKIFEVDASTKMQFKDRNSELIWTCFVYRNSKHFYNRSVAEYACRWAKYMQHLIETQNKTVSQIAENTSYICNIDGITGFQFNYALSALSELWLYGDELLQWYNNKYGIKQVDSDIDKPAMWDFSSK